MERIREGQALLDSRHNVTMTPMLDRENAVDSKS